MYMYLDTWTLIYLYVCHVIADTYIYNHVNKYCLIQIGVLFDQVWNKSVKTFVFNIDRSKI